MALSGYFSIPQKGKDMAIETINVVFEMAATVAQYTFFGIAALRIITATAKRG